MYVCVDGWRSKVLAAIAGQNRPKSRRTRHQQNAHKNKNVLNVSIAFVLLVLSVRELNVLIRICSLNYFFVDMVHQAKHARLC